MAEVKVAISIPQGWICAWPGCFGTLGRWVGDTAICPSCQMYNKKPGPVSTAGPSGTTWFIFFSWSGCYVSFFQATVTLAKSL